MCELVRNKMNLMLVLGGYFEQEQGRTLCVMNDDEAQFITPLSHKTACTTELAIVDFP